MKWIQALGRAIPNTKLEEHFYTVWQRHLVLLQLNQENPQQLQWNRSYHSLWPHLTTQQPHCLWAMLLTPPTPSFHEAKPRYPWSLSPARVGVLKPSRYRTKWKIQLPLYKMTSSWAVDHHCVFSTVWLCLFQQSLQEKSFNTNNVARNYHS